MSSCKPECLLRSVFIKTFNTLSCQRIACTLHRYLLYVHVNLKLQDAVLYGFFVTATCTPCASSVWFWHLLLFAGAPLNAQGHSTSRVFFNAYPLGSAWVFNYNLYYAWVRAWLVRQGWWVMSYWLVSCSCSINYDRTGQSVPVWFNRAVDAIDSWQGLIITSPIHNRCRACHRSAALFAHELRAIKLDFPWLLVCAPEAGNPTPACQV